MKNDDLKKIAKILKTAKKVAIFAHTEPDFDAIGSALALKLALNLINVQADFICSEVQTQTAISFFGTNFATTKFNENQYDTYISVDNPSKSRCEHANVFNSRSNSIVLDHHKNIDLNGKYNYIDTTKSSCCQIVFDFLLKGKYKINETIASYLFAGLSADTSSFINSNTTHESFLAAYKLVLLGANSNKFNQIFYKSTTEKEIAVKKFIYDNYKIQNDIVFCLISYDDMKKLKANKSDFSQVSSELIKLNKANIAFSIVEKEKNIYYVSFRSKIGFPVREIAEKLGGGGHLYACACKIYDDKINVNILSKRVLKEIKTIYQNKKGK